ncbi:hypothetical protein [Streptomyces sp. MST-110588]|uniref:hypothetical protein n=1 Tax=Streptomyces sp. MST-110588 TaxID=2833628 RepID=UPI001F5C1410|nr:hypothetical protein [Streptomyces sp. MST-110588]UNO42905.1 hypothetical protein KGS77_29580 [Streptomyces sp. MST-110588]
MSDTTPSQAEGDRDDAQDATRGGRQSRRQHDEARTSPRTTPSQAEGEKADDEGGGRGGGNRRDSSRQRRRA